MSAKSFQLMGKADAAAYLAMSPRTLERRVKNGDIACVKDGGRTKFRPSDLEGYIADNRVINAASSPIVTRWARARSHAGNNGGYRA